MKKILVIALTVIMVVSAFALTACAQPQTVTGECSYESYGTKYGCKVDVTVKNGIITNVKLYTDEETGWVRTTAPYGNWSQEQFDAAESAYAEYLDKFVGMTVEQANAIVATATAEGQSVEDKDNWAIAGATVSSARIIVAIQNALSKLAA